MIAALLLALQASPWQAVPARATVGDTVRLIRAVGAPPGTRAEVAALMPSDVLEPLGDPAAELSEGRLRVGYQAAFFATGRQAVVIPDLELVYPDGRVETVPGDTAWVTIASVLPVGDSLPDPMPSRGPLARTRRTPGPLVALVLSVIVAALGWGAARRRVSPRPPPRRSEPEAGEAPLARWAAAGELRAVATSTAEQLCGWLAVAVPGAGRHLDTEACLAVLAAERPEWPLRDIAEVLRALERARFAPAVPGDVALLVDEAHALMAALTREPDAAPVTEEGGGVGAGAT